MTTIMKMKPFYFFYQFQDLLEIHSCLVASSPGKICVLPILVVLEPLASLEVTGLDQTGLFVLVPLDSEEILW